MKPSYFVAPPLLALALVGSSGVATDGKATPAPERTTMRLKICFLDLKSATASCG